MTADDSAGLRVTGLTVRDGARDIVSALDLRVRPGQRIAVSGPSSADVTAVLRVLAGLSRPTVGTIMVDGVTVVAGSVPAGVSHLGQDHRLVGTLTAVENLLVTLLAGGRHADQSIIGRAEAQLEALALAPATWHNLVEQLSGGQQQRVALGRALVARPSLAVLDHPTSELDPDTVAVVDDVLTRATTDGVCCVLASDDELVLGSCDAQVRLG